MDLAFSFSEIIDIGKTIASFGDREHYYRFYLRCIQLQWSEAKCARLADSIQQLEREFFLAYQGDIPQAAVFYDGPKKPRSRKRTFEEMMMIGEYKVYRFRTLEELASAALSDKTSVIRAAKKISPKFYKKYFLKDNARFYTLPASEWVKFYRVLHP